jgi:hypothetical protein
VSPEFVDGIHDAGYGWVGDRSDAATHPYPMQMGVDCLLNREVNQILIDWYYDGAIYWPTNPLQGPVCRGQPARRAGVRLACVGDLV